MWNILYLKCAKCTKKVNYYRMKALLYYSLVCGCSCYTCMEAPGHRRPWPFLYFLTVREVPNIEFYTHICLNKVFKTSFIIKNVKNLKIRIRHELILTPIVTKYVFKQFYVILPSCGLSRIYHQNITMLTFTAK